MTHSRMALTAALVALMLTVAAPAAMQAADSAPTATSAVAATPLNTNLLANPGFEQVGVGRAIPGWTVSGNVTVETFGTRNFPSQGYANKWKGGARYLACHKTSGLVRQTVSFNGSSTRTTTLLARLTAYYGGTTGAKIRVAIRMTGNNGEQSYKEKVKVLTITNHYLKAVTTLYIPVWVTHIEATVELMPQDGNARCKMVSDTTELYVYQA